MKFEQVFLITYGRSGSTLLQRVLNSIDGCVVRGENNNALFHIFRCLSNLESAKEQFGIGKGPIEGLSSEVDNNPWFGISSIDLDSFKKDLILSFVKNVIRAPEGCVAYGFKEIRYLDHPSFMDEYLNFIKNSFSNPCFIFNIRDWDDVCKSGFWKNRDSDALKEKLSQFEATMDKFSLENENRCIVLNYNEYVDNPECLKSLFDFLEVDFDEPSIMQIFSHRLSH